MPKFQLYNKFPMSTSDHNLSTHHLNHHKLYGMASMDLANGTFQKTGAVPAKPTSS